MVNLLPLRGVRYQQSYARGAVYSPPYDVITPSEREHLASQDVHNVVRLILGPEGMDATWYTEAAKLLRCWLAEGVLVQDPAPCLYGYEQRFTLAHGAGRHNQPQVRHGLIGRVPLASWGEGIHRHEHTRAGPKADRLNLMRAVRANLSPLFGLYNDPEGLVRSLLIPPSEGALIVADAQGVEHRFWPISQAGAVAKIQAALAAHEVVIADGHHRYETALAYRDERRHQEGCPAERRPYDHVLMYLADAQDPGLKILPTHRVIGCWQEIEAPGLLAGLEQSFDVAPLDRGRDLTRAIAPTTPHEIVLGAYLGPAGSWVLRLKDRARARRKSRSTSETPSAAFDLADLDVVVLQELILEPLLGITADMLTHSDCVSYTIDESEACARVDAGAAQAAFILNPTSVDQVWRAATAGLTMPQKSTYFFPKLLTGLVISLLD